MTAEAGGQEAWRDPRDQFVRINRQLTTAKNGALNECVQPAGSEVRRVLGQSPFG